MAFDIYRPSSMRGMRPRLARVGVVLALLGVLLAQVALGRDVGLPCSRWEGIANPWTGVALAAGSLARASAVYGGDLHVGGSKLGPGAFANVVRVDAGQPQPLGTGIDGGVDALFVYRGELIAGGEFQSAGGVAVGNVARWDGNVWRPLSAWGVDGRVRALSVWGGALIVAGDFQSADGAFTPGVARWDANGWSGLGSGLAGRGASLATFGNDLVVGGEFTTAGALAASNVARWNGANFAALGAGLPGFVRVLKMHKGELFAGGDFAQPGPSGLQRVARWTGSAWAGLAGGVDGPVRTLVSYGADLIAGGDFQLATLGQGPFFASVLSPHVARWNGAGWRPLGPGIFGPVEHLQALDGDVLALGEFDVAGTQMAHSTASWTDCGCGVWSQFPKGFSGSGQTTVQTVLDTPLGLVVGGFFLEVDGKFARSIALWKDGSWSSFGSGLNGIVFALAWHGSELYAGGAFQSFDDPEARNLARWDGNGWRDVGAAPNLPVFALAPTGSELIVGGQFTAIGALPFGSVARYGGGVWKAMDAGLHGSVYSLRAHGGQVFAGGVFDSAGGQSALNVARWDGAQWHSLGGGTDGPVLALTVYGDHLAVGGSFGFAGNVDAHSSALWALDGVSGWSALGSGLAPGASSSGVFALRHIDGKLAAGGTFTKSSGAPADRMAIWTGSAWEIAAGDFDGDVFALDVSAGRLVAGGRFDQIDMKAARSLARWAPCLLAVAQPFGLGADAPSLTVNVGVPRSAHRLFLGIDPARVGAQGSGLAWLLVSGAPDPAFPLGTPLFGFGFTPPHIQPLLIGLGIGSLGATMGPFPWPYGAPAVDIEFSVPPSPALVGTFLFAQGLVGVWSQGLALTNGLGLLIGN